MHAVPEAHRRRDAEAHKNAEGRTLAQMYARAQRHAPGQAKAPRVKRECACQQRYGGCRGYSAGEEEVQSASSQPAKAQGMETCTAGRQGREQGTKGRGQTPLLTPQPRVSSERASTAGGGDQRGKVR